MSQQVYHFPPGQNVTRAMVETALGKNQPAPHAARNVNSSTPAASVAPSQPVPRDQWPAWAKTVAKYATQLDGGVGDTIERCLRMVGVSQIVKALVPSCGCAARQDQFNRLYPY